MSGQGERPGAPEELEAGIHLRRAREWLVDGSPVRIGLVLSGGGLRGASHVGVLS